MRNVFSRARIAICAATIAAFSVSMMTPTPAEAWWSRPGWGWHAGWHHGWRGCCWGPRIAVGIAPVGIAPVGIAVSPPVVYAPPPGRVWVPPHWDGPSWVPGHWG